MHRHPILKKVEYKVFFQISFKEMHNLADDFFYEDDLYNFFPIDFTEIFRLDADCVGAATFKEPYSPNDFTQNHIYDYHLLLLFRKKTSVKSLKETIITAFKNQEFAKQKENTMFKLSNINVFLISQDLKSTCNKFLQIDSRPVFWELFCNYLNKAFD